MIAARGALALAALLVSVGTGAFAQEPEAPAPAAVAGEDRTTVSSCLRDAGDLPRACIGTVAVDCARNSSPPPAVEVVCSRREAEVWRERLDIVAGAFVQRLESGPRQRFAAVQRTWETYAAQKCAFASEMQQPERAAATGAACDLREVALRAIEVERLAARQAQRVPNRPTLQR